MKCKKAKQCNVCDGFFKMERGCLLEKRCPACRFLKIQKSDEIYLSSVRIVPENYRKFQRLKSGETAEDLGISWNKGKVILREIGNLSGDTRLENYNNEIDESQKDAIDIAEKLDIKKQIKLMLRVLNIRQREVITRTIYEDLTLVEIGKAMGITPERVRQIESTAIKILKYNGWKAKRKDEFCLNGY